MNFTLPDYHKGYTLCGVAWGDDGKTLNGQYYRRAYLGRTSSAPDYVYGVATTNPDDFKLGSYTKAKRYTKRPCEFCGRPMDKHDDC